MKIPSHCFRQYDIRGIAEEEFSSAGIEQLGRAIGTYLIRSAPGKSKKVTVGRDARLSSPRLKDALAAGLAQAGLAVIDLGVCPTPVLYFSLFHLKPRGGVMITGSHNPPEYNGFKVCSGKDTLYGKEIQKIGKLASSRRLALGHGRIEKREITSDYINFMVKHFRGIKARAGKQKGFKVVIDSGNGVAGLVVPEILRRLGVRAVELYSEPDGRFPHHHPDPTVPENMRDLIRAVAREKAAAGIGYDGDADRIGVVDPEGRIVWGDALMAIFARAILRENPGAAVIGEVKCSQVMYDEITRAGGRAIMWKTGHSLIKKKMKEEKALLAGEMSGHLFFADRYFGYDDAVYASLRLIELLLTSRKSLSQWVGELPAACATPEIRVDCREEEKFGIVERLKEFLSDAGRVESHFGLAPRGVVTVDGIRVTFDRGWVLARASNTQPALVLRYEAENEKALMQLRVAFEKLLRQIR
jgi:phosphomannomutase/phosphoglucomutase